MTREELEGLLDNNKDALAVFLDAAKKEKIDLIISISSDKAQIEAKDYNDEKTAKIMRYYRTPDSKSFEEYSYRRDS